MANDTDRIRALKQKGEELIAQKLYEKASDAYEEIREAAEGDPVILVKLGDLSKELGDRDKAIQDYRHAAFAYTKLGKITNAIVVTKEILELDSAEVEIIDQVSNLYLELNQAANAVSSTGSDSAGGAAFPMTPLFSDLPRLELVEVINASKRLKVPGGEEILSTDDDGRSIFVITSGSAEVVCKSQDGQEIVCATLDEGDFFGEIGYFSGGHRSANVRAKEDVELLELTRTELRLLIDSHHSIGDVLFDFYKERVLDRLLAVSKIFKYLSIDDRKAVLELVDSEVFVDGMDIVCEGEEGEDMYLIKAGSVKVWTRAEDGTKKVLAQLKEGDSFGQFALILDTCRKATVTALTPVELITFSRVVLKDILSKYPAIQKVFDEEVTQKLAGIERIGEKLNSSLT